MAARRVMLFRTGDTWARVCQHGRTYDRDTATTLYHALLPTAHVTHNHAPNTKLDVRAHQRHDRSSGSYSVTAGANCQLP